MRLWIVIPHLAAAWMATLGGGYTLTRGKWYDLGVASGEIHGRSQILASLCALAAAGDTRCGCGGRGLDVKATSVTLSRRDDRVEIRCSR